MNVRELIDLLQDWPDKEATVVIGEGVRLDRWLLVTGIVGRSIALDPRNPDLALPGAAPGVEIV